MHSALSADVECAICLERVLGTRGRKFGLLENCEHAFCLACIRSWRATAEVGPAGDTVRRILNPNTVRRCWRLRWTLAGNVSLTLL